MPFFSEASMGFAVGVFIVAFMFAIELLNGWVIFIQFFEPCPRFASGKEALEELPVRGWLLYNLAEAGVAYFQLSAMHAFVMAMVLESVVFVAMHLPSPGGTKPLSMCPGGGGVETEME
eukprot:g22707.t1